jgi:APA family basic amino acid/polyamine antiporter
LAEQDNDGRLHGSKAIAHNTLLGDAALLRAVGFWALAAAITNMTIGGAIFVLPGTLAATLGASAPVVFVLGALIFIPIALCFSAAGSRVSASGGPYTYVRAAFGPVCGILDFQCRCKRRHGRSID